MADPQLNSLVRLLQRSAGSFSLVIAVVDHAGQRAWLVEELSRHTQTRIPFLMIGERHDNPLPPIQELVEQDRGVAAIVLFGMEFWMTRESAEAEPFWANLNDARERMRAEIPCPLVMVMPEYLHAAFARAAPDLVSGASTVVRFAPPEGLPQVPMLWLKFPGPAGLSLKDKQRQLRRLSEIRKATAVEALLAAIPLLWWLNRGDTALGLCDQLFRRGQTDEALLLRIQVMTGPAEVLYFNLQKLRERIRGSGNPGAFELRVRAFQLHRDWGNLESAREVIKHLKSFGFHRSSPQSGQVALLSAILELDSGQTGPAEVALDTAQELYDRFYGSTHPFFLEVLYLRACLAEAQGRMKEALQFMERVLEPWPAMVPETHPASRILRETEDRLRTSL